MWNELNNEKIRQECDYLHVMKDRDRMHTMPIQIDTETDGVTDLLIFFDKVKSSHVILLVN